ncbi:tRNA-splicing ligase RtcB (3'-phosphate/5'-hydroxy nucleic acid ligase) [Nematocida sp. AWRm80]|nr:tRNA-splicing ligase RtcB (3'-phosphate/5'-hydroxy nucleic acid ligase) [Nematocida sp. AWRm80]
MENKKTESITTLPEEIQSELIGDPMTDTVSPSQKELSLETKLNTELGEDNTSSTDTQDSEAEDRLSELYTGKGNVNYLSKKKDRLEIQVGFIPGMYVDCIIYTPEEYYKNLFDYDDSQTVIDQLAIMSTFDGAISPMVGLPDIHLGKGTAVGICGTYNADNPNCLIIPEAIGTDINCGVRFWRTNISLREFRAKEQLIMQQLEKRVFINELPLPSLLNIQRIVEEGLEYLQDLGLCTEKDLLATEYNGRLKVSAHTCIGQKPKANGLKHLGTLGSGNHYLEIQSVSKIHSPEDCAILGLEEEMICISAHTGSRGLGHRAFTEFMKTLGPEDIVNKKYAVPLESQKGKKYLEMVGAAANYAFCNRALIGNAVQEAFLEVFPSFSQEIISDMPHNLATVEKVNNQKILQIRKGSTKVEPPHPQDNKQLFPQIGRPVLIGGSMSTNSYLIKAGPNSQMTNYTTCHGSGRILRRKIAKETITLEKTLQQLNRSNIHIRAETLTRLPEESQDAYKDIDKIVSFCEEIEISTAICKLSPVAVFKG